MKTKRVTKRTKKTANVSIDPCTGLGADVLAIVSNVLPSEDSHTLHLSKAERYYSLLALNHALKAVEKWHEEATTKGQYEDVEAWYVPLASVRDRLRASLQ